MSNRGVDKEGYRNVSNEQPKPLGVGMPGWLLLNQFAEMVSRAFGSYPYLVGSALTTKEPRDIDVRLILADDHFHSLFRLSSLNQQLTGWADTCLVWSAYGTQLLGKPVDFQITNQLHVTDTFRGMPRLPIGTPPLWDGTERRRQD